MKVVWRARARADLSAIVAHIAAESPAGAARVHDQILHMISFLVEWPDMARAGRKPGLRELVVPTTSYLVLYRRAPRKVTILRVLHGSQRR